MQPSDRDPFAPDLPAFAPAPSAAGDGPPVPTEPVPAQPVLAQPVLAQPVLAQPVLAQPVLGAVAPGEAALPLSGEAVPPITANQLQSASLPVPHPPVAPPIQSQSVASSAVPPVSPPLPVFEPAPAPSVAPPQGAGAELQTQPPIYRPAFDVPPLPPVVPLPARASEIASRIPRWRWMMSLILIGFYPAFVSLLGRFFSVRSKHKGGSALPSSVRGLVFVVGLDLAIFAVFWGLGWAFSRATKDELLLRWRGGLKPVLQGFGWALGLRVAVMVGLVFVLIVAAVVLSAAGTDPKSFAQLITKNAPKTDALFPKGALSNPLYLLLSTTLLSFVAAGLREELWRTSCLAALRHVFPDSWNDRARWTWAIVLSSMVFGLGHIYQGALGVVLTSFIGAGLGALTWRNRSIWPSVWAHGFFDATSFLLAAAVAGHKIPVPPAWFGWWG